jgi:signal transduction histidine kinase
VGLGLAIAKRLLNLLHGKVEVASELDKGTTFRVTLPVRYAA